MTDEEIEPEPFLNVGTPVVVIYAGATLDSGYVLRASKETGTWRYDIGPELGGYPRRWSVSGSIVHPLDLTDRESVERWLDA